MWPHGLAWWPLDVVCARRLGYDLWSAEEDDTHARRARERCSAAIAKRQVARNPAARGGSQWPRGA